ncbi:MAG: hypothetical protein GF331_12930 [Chitinivibrionales bacterium]|nr:hypothetical protein [Chitinivibrionales bacterium]
MTKTSPCIRWLLVASAVFALTSGTTASASPKESVETAIAGCGCQRDSEVLQRVHDKIAAAQDVQEARKRALAPTRPARAALAKARWLAPWSDDLKDARKRLEDYEQRVREASDPEAVASEFANLVQLASADQPGSFVVPGAALANDGETGWNGWDEENNGGCDYSTGEIIAIVIGFILAIIPGIILLIVLC